MDFWTRLLKFFPELEGYRTYEEPNCNVRSSFHSVVHSLLGTRYAESDSWSGSIPYRCRRYGLDVRYKAAHVLQSDSDILFPVLVRSSIHMGAYKG